MEKTNVTKAVEKMSEIKEKVEVMSLEDYLSAASKCTVNKLIPLQDTLSFVNGVVDMCFDSDDEYMPELLDFSFKYYTLVYYTDMEIPKSLGDTYEFVYLTDVMDLVTSKICKSQYDVLLNAIKEKINLRIADMRYSGQREVDRMKDSMNSLLDEFEKLFSGISHEDIEGLVNAITASGAFDEEKIVKAVLANKDK